MRIFIYEHLTAGTERPGPALESLAREGRAMLDAFANDLRRVPGVAVRTLVGADASAFDDLARDADGVVLIAPELDGTLLRLARRVVEIGGRLLGSGPDAVVIAGDKLAAAACFQERGVPCIAAEPFVPERMPVCGFPAVIKPRRGAGSTGVRLVRGPDDLLSPLPDTPAETGGSREIIATRFHDGIAASMLLIAGPRGILPLRAGEQILARDGTFAYRGGRLPLSPRLEYRARRLALRAASSIPGLLGFAGVDMVLDTGRTDAPDDRVVELNARLTTSYVGLRALAGTNLAEHWLRVIHGEFPAAPPWLPHRVEFFPDGRVERLDSSP